MPFHQSGSIRYYSFESFDAWGLTHAVFTRQGGASQAPWDSLNVGATVGDDPGAVAENRRRAFAAVGRAAGSLYDAWQVHGREVVCVEAPRPVDAPHQKADVLLTDRPGVTLFMRFADCVPVLLFDPVRKVVGLVHAGWQGTVCRAAAAALEAMHGRYGSRPGDVIAAIGPSIGVHHYEVGPEVAEQVRAAFGLQAEALLPHMPETGSGKDGAGRVQFDLWGANQLVLEQAGVRQVEIAGLCTACHPQDWYSHRAQAGRTGRFGVLLAL